LPEEPPITTNNNNNMPITMTIPYIERLRHS
jgi:hypothetical protein